MGREKCQHADLVVIETGNWFTKHWRENGDGEWVHFNVEGNYTAMLRIECTSCKKTWEYSRYKLPKWLIRKFEDGGVCGFYKAQSEADGRGRSALLER